MLDSGLGVLGSGAGRVMLWVESVGLWAGSVMHNTHTTLWAALGTVPPPPTVPSQGAQKGHLAPNSHLKDQNSPLKDAPQASGTKLGALAGVGALETKSGASAVTGASGVSVVLCAGTSGIMWTENLWIVACWSLRDRGLGNSGIRDSGLRRAAV